MRFPETRYGALTGSVFWPALVWALGGLGVLSRLIIGLARIRRTGRNSQTVLSAPLQSRLQSILAETNFTRPLTVLQASSCQSIPVAMTWGIRKATLLLPADAEEWPEERLRVVLLHELAHIRRHDWLTLLLGQFVCALYWFHPLVWMLQRQTQREAERACDDAVLLAGVRAKEYATHLLEVVKTMQSDRHIPSSAVAMARPTQVRDRLQSILNPQRNRKPQTHSLTTLVLCLTALLLCTVSLLRPLVWAQGHPQGTNTPRLPAIGPVVTLPNGIAVELVAVGSSPTGFGDDWWTPTGKTVLELPQTQTTPFGPRESGYPERLLRRALFFRLQAPPGVDKGIDLSSAGYVVDPNGHLQDPLYRYGRSARSEDHIHPPRASAGAVLLGFPPGETRCTYRLGIATGPWEPITTTRLAPQPTPGAISIPPDAVADRTRIVLDETPHLAYWKSQGVEATLPLLGDHAPLGNVARRVIALDKDGKEISLVHLSGPMNERPLPAWVLNRIAAFRIETRPYQWAEFPNIPLTHVVSKKTIPVVASALPAFRHTFTSGITLEVPAVAESRKDGGRWWRPDGKLLSGPVKGYENVAGFFSGWQARKRPRALAMRVQSPRMLTFTAAVRFIPSIPDENDQMSPGEETQLFKNFSISNGRVHDFPPDIRHATLRYGVAAGPWRTVATIPIPTDARHAGPAGDPDQGGVTLVMFGYPKAGDLPTLFYTTLTGEHRELPFLVRDNSYLQDVARRFVAIDKTGRIFPLRSNNGAHLTQDAQGKPIPRDPANAGKANLPVGDYLWREVDMASMSFGDTGYRHTENPIDLSQIREFRMEIRPYEWAEFRNIALQPGQTKQTR